MHAPNRRSLVLGLAGAILALPAAAQRGPGPGPGAGPGPGIGPGPGFGPDGFGRRWNELSEQERERLRERFQRFHGPGQGPGPDEMRRRWDGMTQRQREELMLQDRNRQRQRQHTPGTGRGG
jgi:hypothetical protein